MITKLEKLKLKMYRESFPNIITQEQALAEALEAEDTKRQLGIFDPGYSRFAQRQIIMENMAELLEKETNT